MIRRGTAGDLTEVLALWRAAAAVPTNTDDEDALLTLIRRDPDALLVDERGGELAGTLIAGWNGWRGSFWRLAVHPRHRREGIATALVRAGEERLLELGARRLDAILVAEEIGAAEFWNRLGYVAQPDKLRYVRDV
ncbi:MAG: hypothetical protein QOJ07_595 [Thermoleophilaceae bacterium]|nr:hypothetical protein [Thermoleophilaceae bacterium]